MKNDHIPDDEVLNDIAITEQEIEALKHDLASANISRDRWAIMKAEGGIRQREKFVEQLKGLLKERKKHEESDL